MKTIYTPRCINCPNPTQVDLSMLIISKGFTKKAEEYDNKQAHIHLAEVPTVFAQLSFLDVCCACGLPKNVCFKSPAHAKTRSADRATCWGPHSIRRHPGQLVVNCDVQTSTSAKMFSNNNLTKSCDGNHCCLILGTKRCQSLREGGRPDLCTGALFAHRQQVLPGSANVEADSEAVHATHG